MVPERSTLDDVRAKLQALKQKHPEGDAAAGFLLLKKFL